MNPIAKRQFTLEDLKWFAGVSGDWNPVHVDVVAARRLLAGGVVVHGIFTLLWALNEFCRLNVGGLGNIRARFLRPVLLRQTLFLSKEKNVDDDIRLSVRSSSEEMATIWVKSGEVGLTDLVLSEAPAKNGPLDYSFEDLKPLSGTITATGSVAEFSRIFPHLSSSLGLLPMASLVVLSRLVGMQCPGLNSLLTGLNVKVHSEENKPEISWEVIRHTVALAPIRIQINGGGLAGSVDAFFRPRPVDQPSMETVASAVKPDIFAGQVAWVIGGSRGLGELTAKIIVAGGGEVVISYLLGMADAKRIQEEIISWGGSCKIVQMDVEHPDTSIDEVLAMPLKLSHLYYFASPRISQSKSSIFDTSLYEIFNRIYVTAFGKIMIALSKRMDQGCCVFYPSTVFLDELPPDFGEYIAAKAAGESLCKHLGRHINDIPIIVRRLPMLPTDQTEGLVRKNMADPLVELYGIVSQLHLRFKEKCKC